MPPNNATVWLVLGALAGYALMMWTNPVRDSLRDGWRAIRRYPRIWLTLGFFGFAHSLFVLGTRVYLATILPETDRPVFMWTRGVASEGASSIVNSPESFWRLPRHEFLDGVRESLLPALESLSGLFSTLSTAFPLSIFFAFGLIFLPWRRRMRVLQEALSRRFGNAWPLVFLMFAISALGAIGKAIAYATPEMVPPLIWVYWGQVVAGLSFTFEYLLSVCVQAFLLLLAFAWVRGLSFRHEALAEVAIRRIPALLPWSALILLISTLLIELPLMLKNFPAFAESFPESDIFEHWLSSARVGIAVFIIVTAGVQVRLALHAMSWQDALRDHFRSLAQSWWPLGWFMIIAGFHFIAWSALQENVSRGVGEGTALWIAWRLISPWLAGIVGAWLLASWVCVYKRLGRAVAWTADDQVEEEEPAVA